MDAATPLYIGFRGKANHLFVPQGDQIEREQRAINTRERRDRNQTATALCGATVMVTVAQYRPGFTRGIEGCCLMTPRRITAGQEVTYRDTTGWRQSGRVASSQLRCPECAAPFLLMESGDRVDPTSLAIHHCPPTTTAQI